MTANSHSVPCVHCGLPSPVPASEDELPFCCGGCRGAYHLIHGWGLDDYYALRDRLGADASTASMNFDSRSVAEAAADLDVSETLGESKPVPCGNGMLKSRLAVSGLHCGACAWLIEKAAGRHDGWLSARVRMSDHTVEVVYAADQLRLSEIGLSLGKLGYRVTPLAASDQRRRDAAENRKMLTGIAIAGFCAANSMWIAVALYAGMFSGIDSTHAAAFRWAGMALGVFSVAFPGRVFFRGAWAALVTRTPHMDLPVALGLAVGAIAGLVSTIAGGTDVYFDSIATLTFLLLVGRWVQFRQQRRAAESVSLLMRLTPQIATLVGATGETSRVLVNSVSPGDVVRVDAGETVPVDGVVACGVTEVDRSLVSGESRAIGVVEGDEVLAGCANLQARIDVTVTAAGDATRVSRITQLIEDSASQRARVVQLADSIGGKFVVVVIVLALITLVAWWKTSPYLAANHAVALLIVACPCALALATPLALSVAIGRSAARSILIRGSDVMDLLGRKSAGVVWFDKTGTLTHGKLNVAHWTGTDETLTLLATAESATRHPIAEAVVQYAMQKSLPLGDPGNVQQVAGSGITAVIDSHKVVAGKPEFVRSSVTDWALQTEAAIAKTVQLGCSPLVVAIDDGVAGVVGLGDTVRADAGEALDKIRSLGWRVGMVSGDHEATVRQVAAAIGIEQSMAHAGVEPEQKLELIKESKSEGCSVVMVGDGVNDAAALAAADVGIAIRGGAAASLEAAPVFLSSGQLMLIPKLIEASRRTRQTIILNFALSLSYNGLFVCLAIAGLINPLVAAVIMPISSLTVLAVVWLRSTYRDALPHRSS